MKRTVWIALAVFLWTVSVAAAVELKVGDKAPNLTLKDSTDKVYSLDAPPYQGKVISVFYVDPDEKDMNVHVEDALQKDPALERDKHYKGVGVADLKSTWLPNVIIRQIVESKQKKTGAIVLLDYDATVQRLWGLPKDSSTVVVLDKERVCRYLHKGKVPAADVAKIVEIIKEYQAK